MRKVPIFYHIFEKELWDRVSCEIVVIMMCCLRIRVPDMRSLSDKISAFVMIDLLSLLTYDIQKSCNYLIFYVSNISRSFPFSPLPIILLDITSICHSQDISHFIFLSIFSERKKFSNVSSRSSTRSEVDRDLFSHQIVMSWTCSFTLSTHRWKLDISFSFNSIQSEVSLRSEHTSPNTRRHRGQLFPVIDVTNILSRTRSIWTHVSARIVSVSGIFPTKDELHRIIVLHIPSVRPDPYDLKVSSRTNSTVDINIKSKI